MNLFVLILFALFFILDIYTNLQEGIPIAHIWHEGALFGLAFGAIIWQIKTIFRKDAYIISLNSELIEAKKSYQEWRERSLSSAQELRNMIDQQL